MDPPAPRDSQVDHHHLLHGSGDEIYPDTDVYLNQHTDTNVYLNPPTSSISQSSSAKRRAQVGQWTTPPHPIFPSTSSATKSDMNQDYMQDPYRQVTGSSQNFSTTEQQQAFYAGFLAAQRQQQVSEHGMGEATAALNTHHLHESCPDFSNLPQPHAPPMPHMFPQQSHPPPAPQYYQYAQPPMQSRPAPEMLIPGSNRGSTSLPNISSYAARANQHEDEKRSKRLARNRASARMRRLKKKNLVESYEGEVKVLSACLEKLQNHSWGNDNTNHDVLLQALSMDRGGQQQINYSVEERKEAIKDILKQQCEQVDSFLDIQSEFMMLNWFLKQDSNNKNPLPSEEKELCDELEQVLQLSSSQKQQLNGSLQGTTSEFKSLTTIKQCLTSLLENDHLINPAVDDHINELLSIFHPSQLSKFLLWADHNSEAIDQLDYVNAAKENSCNNNRYTPKFVFGIDNEGAVGHGDD